ncbi:DCN1-like protein 4 [Orbilia oligospora]|uniref:Defective in cullin neddylation protein n=1 Tax=Orbilia oligospora TaxID=2813651 RepID=A0A7C8PEI6_ORBOL|nr:DCN1-like protein 4 [Orbilia oligospora]KAF3195111.1 DCN1-like protein 4 [Orbilia oligospora]KAF3259466.1 DCN1-like protein 4 [Orbilia oligospora]KAF3263948.1 DCN1-like protein 4 [Orbilia oligospora]KAF3287771.1 DCN1-like protein 4 [Orbilia oligospora]
MPPKKKSSVSADTNTAPPTTRRLTRSSSNLTSAKSPTKPTAEVTTSVDAEMGSAVSKAKALKSRKSRKSNGTEVEQNDSAALKPDQPTTDESTTPNGKGKRKTTTAVEHKTTTAKKPKVSKSTDECPNDDVIVIPQVVSKPAKATKKSQPKNVDEWFESYASAEDPNQIDIQGIVRLLEDLSVKFESAAIYVLCWKLGLVTMGSIPREKWTEGMKKYNIANNTQLLKALGGWLQQAKPVSPPSDDFLSFFKYMFQFSKNTPEARTIPAENALAALAFVLNPSTYDLKYDPETAVPLKWEKHPYPHAVPFLEFLAEKQPVKAINKDQWESFLPFNRSVEYMLGNYDPEGAWPALYDQYVDWRKERDGLTIGPKDGPDTEN